MNDLNIFNNSEFGELGVLIDNGKELFPATECARILGYKNPEKAIRDHCKGVNEMFSTTVGGRQKKRFILEGDLFRLIIKSKLPAADRFEHWVFEEVLPSIRKHGAYMTPEKIQEALRNPDTVIQLATDLKREMEERRKLEGVIYENRPKVLFADSVETSHTTILIGDLAKILNQNGVDTGQKRLFQWMRDSDYLIKGGESRNMPTQRSMDQGLFEVKERSVSNPDGSMRITRTTKVTGKGQIYFVNKLQRSYSEDA
jgi:prophage antirepressor-like protein